jgi:hypothetical protein
MDHQDRTLESMEMFARPNPSLMELPPSKRRRISGGDEDGERSQVIDVDGSDEEVETGEELQEERVVTSKYIEESKVALRSIRQLRADVEKKAYPGECPLMS